MNLLKKNYFQLDDEARKSFEPLKQIMSTTPMSETPYFSKPFVIECDASGFKKGAILTQEGYPISFGSMNLYKRECLQYTYNKEILIVMHTLTKWKQCLL